MEFFFKGMILGFAIAAPVGPIGVLCIRRTLQYGRWSGLFSGLGAAFADMLYGVVAVFGLDLLAEILISGQFWFRLVGGIFLLFLGFWTFTARPQNNIEPISHATLAKDFLSTFFLTLTNPLTVLSYAAIFAGLGVTRHLSSIPFQGGWLVLGVFLGSALWWMILSEGVTLFRKRVTQRAMIWVNRVAGLVIAGFGLTALGSLIFS